MHEVRLQQQQRRTRLEWPKMTINLHRSGAVYALSRHHHAHQERAVFTVDQDPNAQHAVNTSPWQHGRQQLHTLPFSLPEPL